MDGVAKALINQIPTAAYINNKLKLSKQYTYSTTFERDVIDKNNCIYMYRPITVIIKRSIILGATLYLARFIISKDILSLTLDGILEEDERNELIQMNNIKMYNTLEKVIKFCISKGYVIDIAKEQHVNGLECCGSMLNLTNIYVRVKKI